MLRAKDNPFAVDRVLQVRYEPPQETWNDLLARLAAMHYRGAIVGPCGSGKTTLCEDLYERLQAQGLGVRSLFITLDIHPSWRDITQTLRDPFDVLLVDGADHLSWWTWQRLKRRLWAAKRGLVVTTHRPGLLPTWHTCQTSPGLLQQIVKKLTPEHALPHPVIEELYQHHQGNIRNALRHLYDLAAQSEL